MKRVHYLSGVIISLFVVLHLFNHITGLAGIERHIDIMKQLRKAYRNFFAESILLIAVLVQIVSGISLYRQSRKQITGWFDKLHIWSGLYLAFFLVIHVSAVLTGRLMLKLDTNFYFAAAGLNSFPFSLFFIPYYLLAVISFFTHVASIHYKKMKMPVLGLSIRLQSALIIITGIITAFSILYGMTNHFKGIKIPREYNILIGK